MERKKKVSEAEADAEIAQVSGMFFPHALDQRFRRDAFFLRAQHDRGAVRVVCADVMAFVATKLLKPHPDVGLDGFEYVAQMQGAIGVVQGAGD